MDSRLILVVIGVIAATFGRSEAITCYSCSSATESKCLDPFKSDGVQTCTGATCTKGIATGYGVTAVVRACSSSETGKDECGDFTMSGITSRGCVCRTDRCNDGQTVKPTLCNVIIGAALATVVLIARMKQI